MKLFQSITFKPDDEISLKVKSKVVPVLN